VVEQMTDIFENQVHGPFCLPKLEDLTHLAPKVMMEASQDLSDEAVEDDEDEVTGGKTFLEGDNDESDEPSDQVSDGDSVDESVKAVKPVRAGVAARSTRRKNEELVLGETIDLDLSNVNDEYALPNYSILAQKRGVRVHTEKDHKLREIPTVVNIAIAHSIVACREGRGMFLWQRKTGKHRAY